MGFPLVSSSVPSAAPVVALNALILPSLKFPTRSAPENDPKVDGAIAIPHGELSGPALTRFAIRAPFRSNVATYPFPGPPALLCFWASCFAYVTNSVPLIFCTLYGAKPAGIAGFENDDEAEYGCG